MARKKATTAKPVTPVRAVKTCPITRTEFANDAEHLRVTIRGANIVAGDGGPGEIVLLVPPKVFKGGTLGWYLNTQMNTEFNGTMVKIQGQVSLQLCYSKSLPGGPADAPAVADS